MLAPALKEFGEDATIDQLIRKYGYCGTPATLKAIEENDDLKNNLGAAAHLMHGSSEGRFSITYCPGHLTKDEIEYLGKKGLSVSKASRRDLPVLLAQQADGATTVAATMIIAEMAGIPVFCTGGIGGVHRRLHRLRVPDPGRAGSYGQSV